MRLALSNILAGLIRDFRDYAAPNDPKLTRMDGLLERSWAAELSDGVLRSNIPQVLLIDPTSSIADPVVWLPIR